MSDIRDLFARVGPAWVHAFELAWASWMAGSKGIGAVLVDDTGQVVAEGRNRVLEGPGSGGAVAGTLLAHAEMDAFASLQLRTADGLTLYSTIEPCLMCSATAIAMRTPRICFAASDPVFEGLDDALRGHPYCEGRMPAREALNEPVLAALARVLPLANRVWSRPGNQPRLEWLQTQESAWTAAATLVETGTLATLASDGASVIAMAEEAVPVLRQAGAI